MYPTTEALPSCHYLPSRGPSQSCLRSGRCAAVGSPVKWVRSLVVEWKVHGMYAGEDGEVCVELGYVGKTVSASKAKQPDKSKAGGWPVRFLDFGINSTTSSVLHNQYLNRSK